MADEDSTRMKPNPEDTFVIEYWGSFKNGVLVDEMNHTVELPLACHHRILLHSSCIADPCPQFKPICKGWLQRGKVKKFHAFDQPCSCTDKCKGSSKCAALCRHKGKLLGGHEKWHAIVKRESIRMFTDAKRTFTSGNKLSSQKGDEPIVSTLSQAGFISLIFSFFCPPVAQLVPGYDVRSQLVSALLQDGKSIPGYLAIHAKDAHGREMASSLVDAQLDASQKLWKAAANAAQSMSDS